MSVRTPVEIAEHQRLIRIMAARFRKEGYTNIKADLEGYALPDPIIDGRGNQYVPDVTCTKNDPTTTRILLEAETCNTIADSHTRAQWRAFAHAKGEFHLVVPKTCEACGAESEVAKAMHRLEELGIAAKKIWTAE